MQQLQPATVLPRSSPGGCAHDLLAAVPGIMRFIRSQMRRHRRAGLTVPQFRSLVFLSHNDDASLSAMAEHLGLSLPAASRMVQLLVSRGLMERQAHAGDRRRMSLSLTRLGRETYRIALSATEVALARSLSRLSAVDRAQVSQAMRVLGVVFSPDHD